VADIHFTPAAAMKDIEHVEKIRINPGNYADKKKFAVREYSDAQYATELERIAEVFSPLVRRARELGVAMRIGTNHGSLSDRIMNRYGDSPEGMVESALEFVRICESHGYRDLILSMKSSNPVVVQQVYRLLAQRMAEAGMDYPFHLGVTEAGDGEDGRIKSALGIGTLLEEGLGDTVRVSLTEDPVAEVPVAQRLVAPYNALLEPRHAARPGLDRPLRVPVAQTRDGLRYERRKSGEVRLGPHVLGGTTPVRVEVALAAALADEDGVRRELDREAGVRVPEDTRAEIVSVDVGSRAELEQLGRLLRSMELVAPRVSLSGRVELAALDPADCSSWLRACHRLHVRAEAPLGPSGRATLEHLVAQARDLERAVLVEVAPAPRDARDAESAVDLAVEAAGIAQTRGFARLLLGLAPMPALSPLAPYRLLAARLAALALAPPLVLIDDAALAGGDPLLGAALGVGGLLCDGIGDSVQLRGQPQGSTRRVAFGVLQAARVRITRTEFISCPSCGRTLFDLEQTTARIKQRTAHLKGVKIAVMGCIVNGPGEMADADFGYVGWGEDKIALFVGKDMVAKDIPTRLAHERLVDLIKQHGRWVDPPVPVPEQA